MASISLTLIVMNGHHGVVNLTRSRLLRDVGGQFVVVRGLSHVVRGQGGCGHVVIGPSFCGRLEVFCSVETETELKYFIEC